MTATPRDTTPARRSAHAREAVSLPQLQRLAVALGMSMLLWLYVAAISRDPLRIQYLRQTVDIRNPGPGLVVASEPPTVSVETSSLRGARDPDDVVPPRVYIDLRNVDAGSHVLPVLVEPVPGVEVTNVQPSQVAIRLERAETDDVKVQLVPADGDQASGVLGRTRPEPARVTASGSGANVRRVDRAVGEIDTEELVPGTTVRVPLVAVNRAGLPVNSVTLTPREVLVRVPAGATATP